jgi:hypothetical protein
MNDYELWYAYGSVNDFLTRRAVYNKEDLYMYPLLISEKTVQGLFVDLAKVTEKLETEPQFYNTVTTNCTNLLADSGNRVNPGSIPFHYSRIFTGFADNKLYDLKLIPHDLSFSEIYEKARIDLIILDNLREMNSEYTSQDFWNMLKEKSVLK